jgi:hypothetical protein
MSYIVFYREVIKVENQLEMFDSLVQTEVLLTVNPDVHCLTKTIRETVDVTLCSPPVSN